MEVFHSDSRKITFKINLNIESFKKYKYTFLLECTDWKNRHSLSIMQRKVQMFENNAASALTKYANLNTFYPKILLISQNNIYVTCPCENINKKTHWRCLVLQQEAKTQEIFQKNPGLRSSSISIRLKHWLFSRLKCVCIQDYGLSLG